MQVEIIKGLRRSRPGDELPFEQLEIGDAMWIAHRSARSLGRACMSATKRLGRQFVARTDIRGEVSGAYVYCEEAPAERAPRKPRAPKQVGPRGQLVAEAAAQAGVPVNVQFIPQLQAIQQPAE